MLVGQLALMDDDAITIPRRGEEGLRREDCLHPTTDSSRRRQPSRRRVDRVAVADEAIYIDPSQHGLRLGAQEPKSQSKEHQKDGRRYVDLVYREVLSRRTSGFCRPL